MTLKELTRRIATLEESMGIAQANANRITDVGMTLRALMQEVESIREELQEHLSDHIAACVLDEADPVVVHEATAKIEAKTGARK